MKFALVITAKNERDALPYNLIYHRYLGATSLFVYDDGSEDDTLDKIKDLPGACVQPSVPYEKYSHLPHFSERVHYPKTDYQFRMMLNAYDALVTCREQGVE
ncbi:MAG: glycosyltransferase family 2 protein, partial [Dehalococcoidia bacterium]|nr:glycosyltransferase family 2 protein [Dehalococcoidia bacterium]